MTRLRLNQSSRDALHRLAREIVTAPAEAAAEAAAYKKAAGLVRSAVEAVYPPKDMRVCRKYEAAKVDNCIKLQLTAGGVEQFDFADDTGPLVVKPTYSGKIYPADDNTTDAVVEWVAARTAHKNAIKAKLSDYSALIQNARAFEDVTEVWPEAEQLRQQFGGRAIAIISPDVIARIRNDVAARQEAA